MGKECVKYNCSATILGELYPGLHKNNTKMTYPELYLDLPKITHCSWKMTFLKIGTGRTHNQDISKNRDRAGHNRTRQDQLCDSRNQEIQKSKNRDETSFPKNRDRTGQQKSGRDSALDVTSKNQDITSFPKIRTGASFSEIGRVTSLPKIRGNVIYRVRGK